MPQVVIASMETRHFSFNAAGATEEDAKAAIVTAWAAHRSQYEQDFIVEVGMPAADFEALDAEFEVTLQTMVLGQGYRDGEAIVNKSKPSA
jgi:hypothetical protein